MVKNFLLAMFATLLGIITSQGTLKYKFSDVGPVPTVCPVIDPSPNPNPSFALQPSSDNNQFLTGNYTVSGEDGEILMFMTATRNENCESNPSSVCSELSVWYTGSSNEPVGQGTLTVTYLYTAESGQERTRTILVNYSGIGIYLEQPGQRILRPLAGGKLDGRLLVYGQPQVRVPLVLCTVVEGIRQKAPFGQSPSVTTSTESTICSPSISEQGPVPFDVFVNQGTGQRSVYVAADEDCSNDITSESFVISFDTTTSSDTTTGESPTTGQVTTPADSGGGIPTYVVVIIAVGIVAVVGLVVCVITCLCYHKYFKKKPERDYEDGKSPGNRSKTPSTSSDRANSPELLIKDKKKSNGHIRKKPVEPHKTTRIYVVEYTDSTVSNLTMLIENIYKLNSHLDPATAAQENGNFGTYVARIVTGGHLVIILDDGRELKNENTSQLKSVSRSRRWINELESSAAYTKEQLQNVFLVCFGVSGSLPSTPVSRLQRIPISDYPHSQTFDPERIAGLIQARVQSTNTGSQPATPALSSQSRVSLTVSTKEEKLDKKLSPLVHPKVDQLRDRSGASSLTDLHSHPSGSGLESGSASSIAMMYKTLNEVKSEVVDLKKAVVVDGKETRKDIASVHAEVKLTQKDIKTGFDDTKEALKKEGEETREGIDAVHEEVQLARNDVKKSNEYVDAPGGSST